VRVWENTVATEGMLGKPGLQLGRSWRACASSVKVTARQDTNQTSIFFGRLLTTPDMAKRRHRGGGGEHEKTAVLILVLTVAILILRHFVYAWAAGKFMPGNTALTVAPLNPFESNIEELSDRIHKLEDANHKNTFNLIQATATGGVYARGKPDALSHLPSAKIVHFAGTLAEDAHRPGHVIRGAWHRELSSNIFEGLYGLQAVRMNNNTHLTALPTSVFDKVPFLTTLHLDGNRIQKLDDGIFAKLSKLNLLDLSGNSLRAVGTGVLSDLRNLQYLNLNNNKIEKLDGGLLLGLGKLVKISLNNNDLASLPNGIFSNLTSLKELHIENNPRLKSMPYKAYKDLVRMLADREELDGKGSCHTVRTEI